MIYPFTPFIVSGYKFGDKTSYGFHGGSDFNGPIPGNSDLGTPLRAISDGAITSIHEHTTGFGKHLHYKISGQFGEVWCHYAHCDKILVKEGQQIKEGDVLATLGNTGNSTGAHLHFEIKLQPTGTDSVPKTLEDLKKWTDPVKFIDRNATINEVASWVVQMFSGIGVDLNKPEGEVRGKVQEVIDGWKHYVDLEQKIAKLEKDLSFEAGQAAEFETRLQLSENTVIGLQKSLGDARDQITARDTEISGLKTRILALEKVVDPETQVVISKEQYARLNDPEPLKRFGFGKLILEAFKRLIGR